MKPKGKMCVCVCVCLHMHGVRADTLYSPCSRAQKKLSETLITKNETGPCQNKIKQLKNIYILSLRLGHEKIPVVYLLHRNLGIPHKNRHCSVDWFSLQSTQEWLVVRINQTRAYLNYIIQLSTATEYSHTNLKRKNTF